MATNINKHFQTLETPQSEPIPGSDQIANNAGGYSYQVDDWDRLDRFLVLGSDGGSYYATERKLTVDNAKAVERCLAADGPRTVQRIVEISLGGRAPKNDYAIFALAMAAGFRHDRGDADKAALETRRMALACVPKVCRIGTHLFQFVEFVKNFRGRGAGLQRALQRWYNDMPARALSQQVTKYQAREGWSHRHVLRLARPTPVDEPHRVIYEWIAKGGWDHVGESPHPDAALVPLWAWERSKRATTKQEVVRLISDHRLPRECVLTQWLNEPEVWEALLEHMPMTAMIRNLGKMSQVGLLKPYSNAAKKVVAALSSQDELRRARVHPMNVLMALKTYQSGHGVRGSLSWTPVQQVVDAMDDAFYLAFGNVPSTGKNWLLALDISGSMAAGFVSGIVGLTPRVASAAMTLVTANTEKWHHFVGFTAGLGGYHNRQTWGVSPLAISPAQRIDDVCKYVSGLPMGGTDCALPMLYAAKNKLEVDVFVIYTDSETWANGEVHPCQALMRYRQSAGRPSKLVVCGMTSNDFTIGDPNDSGTLDVVGFDAATPALMADFVTGGNVRASCAPEEV